MNRSRPVSAQFREGGSAPGGIFGTLLIAMLVLAADTDFLRMRAGDEMRVSKISVFH